MSKRSKRRKKTAISNLTTTISNFETDTIVSNDQDDDALELLDCRTAEDEVIPGAEATKYREGNREKDETIDTLEALTKMMSLLMQKEINRAEEDKARRDKEEKDHKEQEQRWEKLFTAQEERNETYREAELKRNKKNTYC